MTELYIEGVAVVLPENMNLSVKRENPFFTKNGEYTYELTLPLGNTVNATLYKHLNRLNSTAEITTKRRAVLIADNRVYCNGTEIITGWTEKTVSIQIASGNSELNYFIGSDELISSLELGSTIVPGTTTGRLNYIEKTYPDIDFCLPPVMNEGSGEIINKWDVERYKEGGTVKGRLIDNGDTYIAQPFLCTIIRKVCNAIGYDVEVNQLEQTEFGSLYFPHTVDTTLYAKMFPGWTVKELFEEIEQLTNVSFLINSKKHSVQIILNNSYYANTALTSIKNVVDAYEVEVDEQQADTLQECNIAYDLPDDEFYSFAKLSEGILNLAIKKSFDNYQSASNYLLNEQNTDRKRVLALMLDTGDEYIANKKEGLNWHLKRVNYLKNIEVENATKTIELKMIPAALKEWMISTVNNTGGTIVTVREGTYIPHISTKDVQEQDSDQPLCELITENTNTTDESKNELYVAFYQGLGGEWLQEALYIKYPFSFIDCIGGEVYEVPGGSLVLAKIRDKFYNGAYNIDSRKGVKITSYDQNVYDPRGVFEIRNKKYVCREMEYTLSREGRKKAWTGVFYNIKTESGEDAGDLRWILADGKWRDNGVWLDNGRWLDE